MENTPDYPRVGSLCLRPEEERPHQHEVPDQADQALADHPGKDKNLIMKRPKHFQKYH